MSVPDTSDVIIVLAGGIRVNGDLPQSVLLRVEAACKLFQEKRALKILMAGRWSLFLKQNPPTTEAEAMKQYAISLGVPHEAILKEEASNNTTSNAFHVWKQFLRPQQWHNIIVITSDYHLRRTQYIFDWLLGPEYTITYLAVPAKGSLLIRVKRWLNEKLQLFLTQRYLADIPVGGISKIEQKLQQNPGLAGHPMDFLLKRLNRNQAAFFLKLFQWL